MEHQADQDHDPRSSQGVEVVIRELIEYNLPDGLRQYADAVALRLRHSFHVSDQLGKFWGELTSEEREEIYREIGCACALARHFPEELSTAPSYIH